jgi:hypothetical protein
MLILLIIAAVIGTVVSGLTGIGLFGWAAGIFFFVCGLPGALITSFVHGEVSYAQDRADYRQRLSDMAAERIAEEHGYAEEARADRIAEAAQKNPKLVLHDNRHVHLHTHGRPQ